MTKEVINPPFLDCTFVGPGSSYARRSEISLSRKVAILNYQEQDLLAKAALGEIILLSNVMSQEETYQQ
jgi:hypothetical protein